MKKNKVTIIIIISVIVLISILLSGFMVSKMVSKNESKLNIPKDIKNHAKQENVSEGQLVQAEAKADIDRQEKFKKFADKYSNSTQINANEVNSTPEQRTKNGEFYVDNAGDLYSQKFVNIDDMERIEDRLKEAANDMKNVYTETISFNKDNDLKAYFLKGDNKSRFNYLYGISDENTLKSFISKLNFLKNSKVDFGSLNSIKKLDDNNITFQFEIKTKNGANQNFNVFINFADEKAILNVKMS